MAGIPQSLGSSDLFSVAGKVCSNLPVQLSSPPQQLTASQVILITGGGTGLGRFMAEGYVANGAKVYITGRRLDVLQSTAAEINRDFAEMAGSGEVVALQGDVSTKASVRLLVEELARRETKVGRETHFYCSACSAMDVDDRPATSDPADDDGDPPA